MNYTNGGIILKLEKLCLSFGKKEILKDINLEIEDYVRDECTGQVITLLGKSGIGKTQLMKMIAGLQIPSSGRILLGLAQTAPKRGEVGMVLQSYPLFEHRTVSENLKLVSNQKEKIENLVIELDVKDHLKKYPSQLSGGQRQRVAIIQQILCSERFILLDEPFSGLDPVATKKLSRNIRKLADNHSENTIIISSHILEPALEVSDNAIMLGKNGEDYATIVRNYNLVDMGFAWRSNLSSDTSFLEFCSSVRNDFEKF